MESNLGHNSIYEQKKKDFFSRFALKHLSELRLHKEFGLLPKSEGWSNVVRHCLVEAVAAEVMSENLHLSEKETRDLVQAAVLHDFYKRQEMELLKEKGASAENLMAAEEESAEILTEKKINPFVIKLTDSVGLTKIDRMKESDVTISEKVMFYIDMITNNDDIVNLRDRVAALPARYPAIAATGIYPILLKASQEIEAELAQKIGLENPEELPNYIKTKINEMING